jgi:hypothetical protein
MKSEKVRQQGTCKARTASRKSLRHKPWTTKLENTVYFWYLNHPHSSAYWPHLIFLPHTPSAPTALVQYACLASVTVVCTHPVIHPSHPANVPVCNAALTLALHCVLRNHAAAPNEYWSGCTSASTCAGSVKAATCAATAGIDAAYSLTNVGKSIALKPCPGLPGAGK